MWTGGQSLDNDNTDKQWEGGSRQGSTHREHRVHPVQCRARHQNPVTKTNKINPASLATLERERESEYLSGIADQLETEEIHERNESLYTVQKQSMSQHRQETSRKPPGKRCCFGTAAVRE